MKYIEKKSHLHFKATDKRGKKFFYEQDWKKFAPLIKKKMSAIED